ncbi:MAG: hypothetical protein LVQ64_06000, partial [Thermoplasmatales archaeon]|nr:hypothetical protein [Thermoplasmatales archaeon]
ANEWGGEPLPVKSPSSKRTDPTATETRDPRGGGSDRIARPPVKGTGFVPVATVRPERRVAEWERMSAEIRSLASDLDALGRSLRELSESGEHQIEPASLPRPSLPNSNLWPDAWFVLPPPDERARLASIDLRLAQVKRSLGIVGGVVRAARKARPVLELPSGARSLDVAWEPNALGVIPALPLPETPTTLVPSSEKDTARTPRSVRRRPRAFLTTNWTEQFDIQMLNALPLPTLLEEAHGDRAVLAASAQQAEELMARVKREVDDPASAGAFLREQVRYWYAESAKDPKWTSRMTERWAGLFADSRVHGGRLRPWLNHRLWTLRDQAVEGGPIRKKWARKLRGDDTALLANIERSGPDLIRAEVAQAILDDLATHSHDPDTPLPLISLSELAVRRQVVTVNAALGQLFSVPDTGPFVVLHPNRYPDLEEVVIRPPVPRARGAALAFTLGPGRPTARPLPPARPVEREPRGEKPPEGPAAAPSPPATCPREATPREEGPSGLDSDSIWEAESVAPSAWREVVEAARESRGRLSQPPGEFRSRGAYSALMDLLLDDDDFRRTFLGVRWRTRPAGPPLLASLLAAGSLAPEVSTDHEYLEAELDELVRTRHATKDSEGAWTVRGWTIAREGSHAEGFRFRAQRAP